MKSLILIIITLLFSGCFSSARVSLEKEDVLENRFVAFNSPSDRWYLIRDKKWSKSKKIPNEAQWIKLYARPKGASYTIEIQTFPFKWWKADYLFDKNSNFKTLGKDARNTPETLARNKEQRIGYDKDETQYINGLKCWGSVFSRSSGGSAYSLTSKNYSITCGYYDKTVKEDNGKRILGVIYRYGYAGGNSRLQKDADLSKSDMPSVLEIENNFKEAIKELVKTIKIKNFDRERMEKEGLMHYDKEFKSTKW